MLYEELRSNIKSGDVIAWTHKGCKTWSDIKIQIVRMFTRSEYSHVGIAWVVADRVFVIDAVIPKVRIFPLSKELPFFILPCGDKYWSDSIEEILLSHVGEEYSTWQAILAAFNKLKCGKDVTWQCAELVNMVLQSGNIFKENESLSTPTSIVENLQKKGTPLYMVL